MNPDNEVDQDDNGGQVGYMIPRANSGVGDIYVAHQASDSVLLYQPPPNDPWDNQWLYAPTSHGSKGSCWEVTTAYQYYGTYNAGVWFFNFCDNGGTFEGGIPMNQSFYNDYVRTWGNGNGTPEYILEIKMGTDNAWHVLLWNANSSTWLDVIDSDPGQNSNVHNGDGWSIFETHYSTGPCSEVPSLSMSGLRLHHSHVDGQAWQYANEDGSKYGPFGRCFPPDLGPYGTYFYTINWNTQDYGWFSQTNPS